MKDYERWLIYPGILALASVTIGQVKSAAQKVAAYGTLKAESLELVDAEGRVRARLAVEKGVPNLVMFGEDGSRRVDLAVYDSATRSRLLNDDGQSKVSFHANQWGGFVETWRESEMTQLYSARGTQGIEGIRSSLLFDRRLISEDGAISSGGRLSLTGSESGCLLQFRANGPYLTLIAAKIIPRSS